MASDQQELMVCDETYIVISCKLDIENIGEHDPPSVKERHLIGP